MSYANPNPTRPPPGGIYRSEFENHRRMALQAGIPEKEFNRESMHIESTIRHDVAFAAFGPVGLTYEIDQWRYDLLLKEHYGDFQIPYPQGGVPQTFINGIVYNRRGPHVSLGSNTIGHQMGSQNYNGYQTGSQNYNSGWGSGGGPGYHQQPPSYGGSQFQQQPPQGFGAQQVYNQPIPNVGGSQKSSMVGGAQLVDPDESQLDSVVEKNAKLLVDQGTQTLARLAKKKADRKAKKKLARQKILDEEATAKAEKASASSFVSAVLTPAPEKEYCSEEGNSDQFIDVLKVKVPHPDTPGLMITVAQRDFLVGDRALAEYKAQLAKKAAKKATREQPGADMVDKAYQGSDSDSDKVAVSTVKKVEPKASAEGKTKNT